MEPRKAARSDGDPIAAEGSQDPEAAAPPGAPQGEPGGVPATGEAARQNPGGKAEGESQGEPTAGLSGPPP
jgi:hypothetical protein